jgi:hypothetical protein
LSKAASPLAVPGAIRSKAASSMKNGTSAAPSRP